MSRTPLIVYGRYRSGFAEFAGSKAIAKAIEEKTELPPSNRAEVR